MVHQIAQFVINHWMLAAVFVVLLALLLLEETKGRNDHLTTSGMTHLINREDAVVIDVRDPTIFREGHIVNAKNIPLADWDRHLEKLETYRERPIIVMDAMGAKTPQLVLQLKKAGFQKPFSLKGGMDAWKSAGMPVIKK